MSTSKMYYKYAKQFWQEDDNFVPMVTHIDENPSILCDAVVGKDRKGIYGYVFSSKGTNICRDAKCVNGLVTVPNDAQVDVTGWYSPIGSNGHGTSIQAYPCRAAESGIEFLTDFAPTSADTTKMDNSVQVPATVGDPCIWTGASGPGFIEIGVATTCFDQFELIYPPRPNRSVWIKGETLSAKRGHSALALAVYKVNLSTTIVHLPIGMSSIPWWEWPMLIPSDREVQKGDPAKLAKALQGLDQRIAKTTRVRNLLNKVIEKA